MTGLPRTTLAQKLYFLDCVALVHEGEDCCLWPYHKDRDGYPLLSSDDNSVPNRSHQYVCAKVHGPRPSKGHEASHSCGIRACVSRHHLIWKARGENQKDRLAHGTHGHGERGPAAKLTNEQAIEIRNMSGSHAKIAKLYGVSASTIGQIKRGKTFRPKYCDPQASPLVPFQGRKRGRSARLLAEAQQSVVG